ncbi:radical SAM/SPASM domain-containing protein [Planctomycetota bacterium]
MDKWDLIEADSIRSNIPIKGIIELNYTCNFRCVFCYLGNKRTDSGFLDRDRCRILFRELRKAGTLVLTFTGGEPFLNSDFIPILEDARSERFAVRIFTNGSLIGPAEAKALKGIHPLSVDVSLYGASEDTYSAVTGDREHFGMTVQGLESLRDAKVDVIIKMVANRLNIHELETMKQLAHDMGFKTAVTPLLTPDDCGDFSPCNFIMEEDDLASYFEKHGRKPGKIGRGPDEIICTSGRNAFVISPEGDVYPCIQIRQSVGNVFSSSFKSIWKDNPHPLLDMIRNLTFGDFKECCSCPSAHYCFFCPGLALLESGSLTGKNLTACRFTEIKRKVFNI